MCSRAKQDSDELVEPVRRLLKEESGEDALNRLLKIDARLSLADDLLIIADHMSMASSVELRVPFLDLQFLSLIESMPSRFKISRFGERKWLYRRAVAQSLPGELKGSLTGWGARTGRKLGFSTPLDDWFGNWVRQDAETFLLGRQACSPAYLSADYLVGLIDEARDDDRPRSRQLMSLFVLETWLRRTLGGETPSMTVTAGAA
jgi:asparagine synthase (glutamine-hydrolysing)